MAGPLKISFCSLSIGSDRDARLIKLGLGRGGWSIDRSRSREALRPSPSITLTAWGTDSNYSPLPLQESRHFGVSLVIRPSRDEVTSSEMPCPSLSKPCVLLCDQVRSKSCVCVCVQSRSKPCVLCVCVCPGASAVTEASPRRPS